MLEKYRNTKDLPEIIKLRRIITSEFSDKLQFKEDTHQYFLGEVEYDCVSNVTHRFKEHVDFGEKAERKALREGRTKEGILKEWDYGRDLACATGTATHEFGESYFYYALGEYSKILPSCKCKFLNGTLFPTNKREEAVVRFWEDLHPSLIPILAETKVFCQEKAYAGTFDILFYWYAERPEDRGLVIYDYKTNKDLYNNFRGQTLLYPFTDLLDMPLSLYTLQLSAYEIPLRQLGLPVVGRRVIWIKEDSNYTKLNIPDVKDRLWNAM